MNIQQDTRMMLHRLKIPLAISALTLAGCASLRSADERILEPAAVWPDRTSYHHIEVLGRALFYREAGDPNRPTIVLLHGYPSSSHTYRELIPLLSGRYHIIAPDNLGSGYSEHPSPEEVEYTFDLLAEHCLALTEAIGVHSYVLYMQDFGAPVGFRVAMSRPEKVLGIIIQNGNAYLDGLTPPRREFFQKASNKEEPENAERLLQWVSDQAIREGQYLRDVPGQRAAYMSPDSWTHDISMMPRDEDRRIQVQLFQDYQNNIDAYPSWQSWMSTYQPPALIMWGERDPAFIVAGAHAYLRDLPNAELHILDAGHFAAEELPVPIAKYIIRFMEKLTAEE